MREMLYNIHDIFVMLRLTVSASILTSFDANHALFTPPAGAPVTRAAALERLVGAPRGTASLGQVGGVVALDVNKVLSVVWRSKGASSAVQESQAIVLANEHHLPYFMFGGRPTVGGTLTLFYNAFSRGFWYASSNLHFGCSQGVTCCSSTPLSPAQVSAASTPHPSTIAQLPRVHPHPQSCSGLTPSLQTLTCAYLLSFPQEPIDAR